MTSSARTEDPSNTEVGSSVSQKIPVLNTQGLMAQLITTNAMFHTYKGKTRYCPVLWKSAAKCHRGHRAREGSRR